MTPCVYRGEVFREERNQFCGFKKDLEKIYRCRLHVLCCERKWKHGQTERCCLTCDDYEGRRDDERKDASVGGSGLQAG